MKQTNTLIIIVALAFISALGIYIWTVGFPDMPLTSDEDAGPGSLVHDLELPEALKNVRAFAAASAGVNADQALVMESYEREWPDSCIGLPEQGEVCARVITPGLEVTIFINGIHHVYHSNKDGTIVRAKN